MGPDDSTCRDFPRIPFTVQHGDFRPNNVLFDAADGDGMLAALDW
ncbi:phosphotransferase [Gordonia oryzae]|nr:phosphotransferase [Gordonia oryzae]